ncbi:MAG: microcin C ABC transporter permease YejB [Alphaproteobacteria bacterium]|nr:microcin C ABC transporter permease YejB [Alphaproteobacteria bacterium]
MWAYVGRRLLLMIPTLFGIMVINFFIIQLAPGGPVEQRLAEMRGIAVDATQRFAGGAGAGEVQQGGGLNQPQTVQQQQTAEQSRYRGARGVDPRLIREIEQQYGFDKPIVQRFFLTMKDFLLFRFGDSYFRDQNVIEIIIDKLPVSISLGLWTMLIIYFICIPLGIAKAVREGSKFDASTTTIVLIGYAIPDFLFAILLIVLFAGGSYWNIFPIRGLVSPNWDELVWYMKIADYAWHMVLPVTAMVIGGFATLTFLVKNLFLEEIKQQYVVTARAKGATPHRVLYGHVFRNAMLLIITGFPAAFLSIFFAGVLLIEIIFSLDGLGRLFYDATIRRDYPLMFGSLYIGTLMALVMGIIRDVSYAWVDPRIHFERVEIK